MNRRDNALRQIPLTIVAPFRKVFRERRARR